jgi:hypothetical protein
VTAVVNTVMNLRLSKGGEFLDYLSDCQLLKKDSAPWNLLFLSVQTSQKTHRIPVTKISRFMFRRDQ